MGRSRRRIWPFFFKTVGAMFDHGVIVRVGCVRCGTIFDVDLRAIALRRGRDYCLIDREVTCKVTKCRGTGFFLAACSMTTPLLTLLNAHVDPLSIERNGLRPIDIEPPEPPDRERSAARVRRA